MHAGCCSPGGAAGAPVPTGKPGAAGVRPAAGSAAAHLAAGPLNVPQNRVVQQRKAFRVAQCLCTQKLQRVCRDCSWSTRRRRGAGPPDGARTCTAARCWQGRHARLRQPAALSRCCWPCHWQPAGHLRLQGAAPAMPSSPATWASASITIISTALATCGANVRAVPFRDRRRRRSDGQ